MPDVLIAVNAGGTTLPRLSVTVPLIVVASEIPSTSTSVPATVYRKVRTRVLLPDTQTAFTELVPIVKASVGAVVKLTLSSNVAVKTRFSPSR